jgi:protein phosphatase
LAKQHTLTEFESAGLSITGPVREDNQDSISLPGSSAPSLAGSLHAVADGMGGHANGALASSLALQHLVKIVRASDISTPPRKVLKQAFEVLNFEVYKASQQLDNVRMGTTLTAAHISGSLLNLLHIGDSRAYLIRHGRAACLTQDHTTVGEMVRARLIPPERLRTHEKRSVLTRAVGLALFAQPELTQTTLQIGDRIVLCSDGVWSVIEDQEFAEHSDGIDNVNQLADDLVNLAIARGTDDNCSVIAIQIRGFRYQTYDEAPPKERNWLNFLRR